MEMASWFPCCSTTVVLPAVGGRPFSFLYYLDMEKRKHTMRVILKEGLERQNIND